MKELASLACRDGVACVFPQVLTPGGRIAFSGYGIRADGSLFIRNLGQRPNAADPILLETSVHQVACGTSRCVMLKRSLYRPITADGAAWSHAFVQQGLVNLVSPHAAAVTKARLQTDERLPSGTHDGTLMGEQNSLGQLC